MNSGYNVLSLFNGHSGGKMALDMAGVKVNKYFSSEIDKYANKVSDALYPEIIQIGDVTKVKGCDLPKIDIIMGGSPCQGFSFAGKQLNFDDPRSKLFFEFVRLVKECKPRYFFLENVSMKQEHENVITDLLDIEPVFVNSALVSAQNRKRLYWTNIPCSGKPKDEGIMLKDILEDDIPEKYFIKNPKFDFEGMSIEGKGKTLRTGGHSSQSEKHNYDLIKTGKVSNSGLVKLGNINDKDCQGNRVYSTSGKSSTLMGLSGGYGGKTGLYAVGCAMRGRNKENPSDRTKGIELEQKLEINKDGKSNCLSTVQKDSLIITHSLQPKNGKGIGGKGHLQKKDQKSYCLDTANGQAVEYSQRIRRLTPRECGKLQTVPEHLIDKMLNCGVSDTQLYKMFGNGWTIKVIAWFFEGVKTEKVRERKQTTIFEAINSTDRGIV